MQAGPIQKDEMDNLLNEKKNQILLIRVFDFLFALIGLVILSPLFLLMAILIKADSKGAVFFKQERVGKDGKPFQIYKFRSMVQDAQKSGTLVTASDDERQTKVGRFLRHTKLDELPQLFNVLRGDMALVGPRPEVPRYVAYYDEPGRQLLRVKPGITDLASVIFKDEAEILARYQDRDKVYIEKIMPLKQDLNTIYIRRLSLWESIKVILKTIGLLKVEHTEVRLD